MYVFSEDLIKKLLNLLYQKDFNRAGSLP